MDKSGEIYRFHAHAFRHTVGTRMINNGMPQHIVQKFLGHESPEMTSRYAHIFDETTKK
ncbi:tranposase B [Staphylococcus aureus subsp. aureus SA8601]|nr:tranposase B [Staphylococcus aureus subsp. aureus SA8601]